jgi:hypothetical protein
MPLIMRALTNPDGSTPPAPNVKYVVSGTGTSGYFWFPGQTWDTIEIGVNAVSIPDRDFANAVAEPGRAMLAYYVDQGYVSVWDTVGGAFLTGDGIRTYA